MRGEGNRKEKSEGVENEFGRRVRKREQEGERE